MTQRITYCAIAIACIVFFGSQYGMANEAATAQKPLLVEGKTAIYQRVLTAPGAMLTSDIGQEGEAVPAFSVYYVYAKEKKGGTDWLKLGTDAKNTISGWMKQDNTVPWKQQISLVFTNSAGRERSLLFASQDKIDAVWNATSPAENAAAIRTDMEDDGKADGVLSIEPEEYIDFSKNFYLLPITDFARKAVGTPARERLSLEVASVSKPSEDNASNSDATTDNSEARRMRGFNAAIVFVIDTTISMGPYIDQTREMVKSFYDKVGDSDLADYLKFGLVGYRSHVASAPGLEYTSKLFVDPNEMTSGEAFLETMKTVTPATVSSPLFDEDAYAGVMMALKDIDWSEFGGRYIILVTDAGAIDADSQYSSTNLGAEQVRIEAAEKGVGVFTMHMKTSAGTNNHGSAESEYQQLSANDITNLYYDVSAGNAAQYRAMAENLADVFLTQVGAAFEGQDAVGKAPDTPEDTPDDAVSRVQRDAALMGKAMALAYLGRVEGTRAPDFFKAWLPFEDFADPSRKTADVRVLLTRNQLNDLHLVLKELLDQFDNASAEDALSADDFFDAVRSMTTMAAVDPAQINDGSSETMLADAGLFDEYVQDLPYESDLMKLSFDRWDEMDVDARDRMIRAIRRKLNHYQLVNEDEGRWVTLTDGAPIGEAVYPIPLDMMP